MKMQRMGNREQSISDQKAGSYPVSSGPGEGEKLSPSRCPLALFFLTPLVTGRGAFYNPSNTAMEGVVLFTRRLGFGRRKERLCIP
jgi:hypothetical protein